MTGYLPMLGKEFTEIVRTWRCWLLGGAFVVFGIIDPVLARFTQQILASVIGDQLPIVVPPATYLDAWAQWTKDLSQLLMIVVLVIAAGTVAGEVNSQTAILPLTKPLSRAAFVLAKLTALTVSLSLAVAIGTALVCASTALLFDGVKFAPLWRAVAVWLVLAIFLIAVTMLASCLVNSTIAAFGIGFGGYLLLTIAGMWQPARAYSPAGLPEAVGQLATGHETAFVGALSTSLGATALLVVLAVLVFLRREL